MAVPHTSSGTRWSIAGLVALVLVGGTLVPLPTGRRPEFGRFGPDKALHLLGHGGLAATLADALAGEGIDPLRSGLLAIACSVAISLGTGVLQRYVPGRAHERADVVAGVLGSVLGVLWWYPRPDDSTGPERRVHERVIDAD